MSKARELSKLLNTDGSVAARAINWELDADGDGTLDWPQDGQPDVGIFNNDAGYITINDVPAAPTYTASNGLSLNGTAFSISGDLKGHVHTIGTDAGNYLISSVDHISAFFGGSGATNEKFRFDKNGNLYAKGDVVAATATMSDPRLKENVTRIDSALDKVESLSGYTFTYKHNGRDAAGVMADEVERVLPSAVREMDLLENSGPYKTVRYGQLHALLIEAVKELSAQIKELKNDASDVRTN